MCRRLGSNPRHRQDGREHPAALPPSGLVRNEQTKTRIKLSHFRVILSSSCSHADSPKKTQVSTRHKNHANMTFLNTSTQFNHSKISVPSNLNAYWYFCYRTSGVHLTYYIYLSEFVDAQYKDVMTVRTGGAAAFGYFILPGKNNIFNGKSVSYTHLTLPTIYSV